MKRAPGKTGASSLFADVVGIVVQIFFVVVGEIIIHGHSDIFRRIADDAADAHAQIAED